MQAEVHSRVEDEAIVAPPQLGDIASLAGTKRLRRAESVLSSRSELMEQVRQQVAEEEEDEAVATQKQVAKVKKKKKKKKYSSYFDAKETLKLVAGVGAFVAVLAFLAWGYPEFRFPLGGLLCVIGFIVYLLGSASLRQLVAEEGALKASCFGFVRPISCGSSRLTGRRRGISSRSSSSEPSSCRSGGGSSKRLPRARRRKLQNVLIKRCGRARRPRLRRQCCRGMSDDDG